MSDWFSRLSRKSNRAKCLNHTHYEPSESGSGIYRELAPGHVTIVTVPNQRFQNLRDPLRPYTSLGLLEEINAFLIKRASCFAAKLHVKNPQFEEVRAVFNVRLNEGFDETFYVNAAQIGFEIAAVAVGRHLHRSSPEITRCTPASVRISSAPDSSMSSATP